MELADLKGVGPVRMNSLRAMGIFSLRDLLYTLPVRYEDRTTVFPCSTKQEGYILVCGTVPEKPKISHFHGLSRVTAAITDESGRLSVCWYNEPWMMEQLPVGPIISLYGRLSIKNNRRILQNPVLISEYGWYPVYRSVKGIPAKSFRNIIKEALMNLDECCPETLPASFRLRYHLCELNFAIRQAHFPDSIESLQTARRRLSFESALIYMMYVSMHKGKKLDGRPLVDCSRYTAEYWKTVPFMPTEAQKRVLCSIASDMEKPFAMCRLIQGDVGCGKTAVAFGAIYIACKNHIQSAMMAPTEILAEQHYQNAKNTLEPYGVKCRLLTGSTKAKERKIILQELANKQCDVVFGTHALISNDVLYSDLGLVITDEQHRFGVIQRGNLQLKGKNTKSQMPHVLVMSATPIPRTLALILYGDLDISIIDELPPGRIPVKTRLVPPERRSDMYRFLREKIKEGFQAYVVCPLVEENENGQEMKSAKAVSEELKKTELSGCQIGLTWGSQKSQDKISILHSFSDGKLDVLVSTTVIEVGVNVPNASIMIIENAERFGLSQLHQLRGRVGRGTRESWCFLLSESTEKLRVLCVSNDGFEISRKDLELRGPGDLLGTRQAGEPVINLPGNGDMKLLDTVSECVHDILRNENYKSEKEAIQKLSESYFSDNRLFETGMN